jgi:SH3 domain protein
VPATPYKFQTLPKDKILRNLLAISIIFLITTTTATAQAVRYVSDTQYIPLRSGPGNEFRITHRGIPSGTRLKIARTSEDGVFAEITTDRGTTGWIRTQYLMAEVPAQLKLDAAIKKAAGLETTYATLTEEASLLKAERVDVLDQFQSTDSQLQSVTQELTELKKISAKAVQLDSDNRRLSVKTETLKSDLELLRTDNQRLSDKLQRQDFINGALAVLLGVIITLVVPRLWPKRRRNSSWA